VAICHPETRHAAVRRAFVSCNRKFGATTGSQIHPDGDEPMDLGLSRSTARERMAALAHRPCITVLGATAKTLRVPRTSTAALRSTSGSRAPSVAVRQFCGTKASIQAIFSVRRASTSLDQHRKEAKEGERE
jgi:hypothetical protein